MKFSNALFAEMHFFLENIELCTAKVHIFQEKILAHLIIFVPEDIIKS